MEEKPKIAVGAGMGRGEGWCAGEARVEGGAGEGDALREEKDPEVGNAVGSTSDNPMTGASNVGEGAGIEGSVGESPTSGSSSNVLESSADARSSVTGSNASVVADLLSGLRLSSDSDNSSTDPRVSDPELGCCCC
jgi:hypothetical protein